MNDGLHGLGLISRRDEGPGLFFIFGSAVDDPSLFALAGKKKMQRLFTILGGLRFFVHDKGEILGQGMPIKTVLSRCGLFLLFCLFTLPDMMACICAYWHTWCQAANVQGLDGKWQIT